MAARDNIVLQEGINAIHSGTFGSYFALKYFLPMYDPTIDDDIHNGTQANTDETGVNVRLLSAAGEATTATYSDLKGEKLFKPSGYTQVTWGGTDNDPYILSDDRDYVISASPNILSAGSGYTTVVTCASTTSITNTSYSQGNKVNLVSGTNGVSAISDVLSGTDLVADGAGTFEGTNIALMNKVTEPNFVLDGSGENTSAVSLLYPVTGYTSIATSDANINNGRYEIYLSPEYGNFRFNKVVLFAVALDSSGEEDPTVLPVPFSVHSFEGTVIKTKSTTDGTGLGYRALIQLQFAITADRTNLSSVHVSNWSDLGVSAQELNTDKKVNIYSGAAGRANIPAKLTVVGSALSASTPVPTPIGDKQLALGYDNNTYSYLWTDQQGDLNLSASGGLELISNSRNVTISAGDNAGTFYIQGENQMYIDAPNVFIGDASKTLFTFFESNVIFRNSKDVTFNAGTDLAFNGVTFDVDATGKISLVNDSSNGITISAGNNSANLNIQGENQMYIDAPTIYIGNASKSLFTFMDNDVYFRGDDVTFNVGTSATFNDVVTLNGTTIFNGIIDSDSGIININADTYLQNLKYVGEMDISASNTLDLKTATGSIRLQPFDNVNVQGNVRIQSNGYLSLGKVSTLPTYNLNEGKLFTSSISSPDNLVLYYLNDSTSNEYYRVMLTSGIEGETIIDEKLKFGEGGFISYEMIDTFTWNVTSSVASASSNIPLTDDIYDIRIVAEGDIFSYSTNPVWSLGSTSASTVWDGTPRILPGIIGKAISASDDVDNWTIELWSDVLLGNPDLTSLQNYRAIVWYKKN